MESSSIQVVFTDMDLCAVMGPGACVGRKGHGELWSLLWSHRSEEEEEEEDEEEEEEEEEGGSFLQRKQKANKLEENLERKKVLGKEREFLVRL